MYELLGCFKVNDKTIDVADQLYAGFTYFKTLFFGEGGLTVEFWAAFRNTFLLSFYGLCFGFPMPIIIAETAAATLSNPKLKRLYWITV